MTDGTPEELLAAATAAVERADRIGVLAAALVGTLSVEDVARVLTAHLRAAVDGQTYSLRELRAGAGAAPVSRVIRVDGTPAGYGARYAEVDLDRPSALREVFRTGRPVFLVDAADNRARYGEAADAQHTAARIEGLARLPLVVEGEPIAVLSVGYRNPQQFPAQDRFFLTTVANLAAQALGRAMRTELLRREADRARRLGGLAAALAIAGGVSEVGAVLAEHVLPATAADAFSLRMLDLQAQVARTLHAGGAALHQRERYGDVELNLPSALAEAVATRRPVFVTSADQTRARFGVVAAERYEAAHVEAMARFPLLVEGEPVAILSVGYWSPREFEPEERLFLTTVADLAAQALGRAMSTEQLRADERRHRLLSKVQAAINRRMNPIEQLQALTAAVVPALADLATVHVLHRPAALGTAPVFPVLTDRVASAAIDALPPAPLQDGIVWDTENPITEIVRRQRPHAIPFTAQRPAPAWAADTGSAASFHAGLRHLVSAPVVVDGLVTAVVSFGMCQDRTPWTQAELETFEQIADYAATALTHGLTYQHTRETALTLQHALLSPPPLVPGLELGARYRAAGRDRVGGDWHDALRLESDGVALAVGDVVGHDITAAAAMGQLRAVLRAFALQEHLDPRAVLRRLAETNRALRITAYATVLFARLVRRGPIWAMTWSSAGHLPPVLVDPAGKARLLEDAVGGPALAPTACTQHRLGRVDLEPGSLLILFTDGLVERRGHDLRGDLDRLCDRAAALADQPVDRICDALLQQAPDEDDAALLIVRVPT